MLTLTLTLALTGERVEPHQVLKVGDLPRLPARGQLGHPATVARVDDLQSVRLRVRVRVRVRVIGLGSTLTLILTLRP